LPKPLQTSCRTPTAEPEKWHPIGDELRALRRLQREARRRRLSSSASGDPVHNGRLCPDGRAVDGLPRASISRLIRTCCATPAAKRSLIRATTLGQSRLGSAIDRSIAVRSTRPWRPDRKARHRKVPGSPHGATEAITSRRPGQAWAVLGIQCAWRIALGHLLISRQLTKRGREGLQSGRIPGNRSNRRGGRSQPEPAPAERGDADAFAPAAAHLEALAVTSRAPKVAPMVRR
jgi:hypothetical protein